MESNQYLKAYYDNFDEDSRLTDRCGMVEYMTTMNFIQKYLSPGCRIMEIGAGTGRYSHALARMGYQVDAVELMERNIEVFRKNTLPSENITVTQGNAIALTSFPDNTFDLTLLLGPMYHLFTRADQEKAISEAVRITRKGGIIFAAYCMSDASIINYGFVKGNIHALIEKGLLNPETFETFSHPWDIFELYRKDDIDALRKTQDVSTLHFAAADGLSHHMEEAMNAMDDETFEIFMKYHLATCERPELTGYSNHTLDIFQKN